MRKILFSVCLVLFVSSCDEDVEGCVDSLAENYNVEATLDDGSCEYIEIGANYQGGIVFYIDSTGEHGLIAAPEDATEGQYEDEWGIGFQWGCYEIVVDGADVNSIGSGYQNTLDIIIQGCEPEFGASEFTAAQAAVSYTSGGYEDWFLPSPIEMYEMYYNVGSGSPMGNIANFSDKLYWTSYQSNVPNGQLAAACLMWDTYVSVGFNAGYKNTCFRVRPIRSF
mgnify:CR=1 FL=1